MNESEVTREVVKKLIAVPRPTIFAVKIHGGPHQRKGLPDIAGCVEGQCFGIEMKLDGNRPTPIQKSVLAAMSKAGAITAAVTVPGSRAGVQQAFEEILDIIGVEL